MLQNWLLVLICINVLNCPTFAAIQVPEGLKLCEGYLHLRYAGEYDTKKPRRQLFKEILGRDPLNPVLIIEFLAEHPLLKPYDIEWALSYSAGVWEGYSLREHNKMVYTLYREQRRHYDLDRGELYSLNFRKLFEFAIAFHDIGKPFATRAFEQESGQPAKTLQDFRSISLRQAKYTIPLIQEIVENFGLKKRERRLVMALVKDDVIGAVITKKMSIDDALSIIKQNAKEAKLKVKDYFMLKTLMYVSDAGSYPGIRFGHGLAKEFAKPPVFIEQDDGLLTPVSPLFHQLADLVANRAE